MPLPVAVATKPPSSNKSTREMPLGSLAVMLTVPLRVNVVPDDNKPRKVLALDSAGPEVSAAGKIRAKVIVATCSAVRPALSVAMALMVWVPSVLLLVFQL